jgi:hypothetical protein
MSRGELRGADSRPPLPLVFPKCGLALNGGHEGGKGRRGDVGDAQPADLVSGTGGVWPGDECVGIHRIVDRFGDLLADYEAVAAGKGIGRAGVHKIATGDAWLVAGDVAFDTVDGIGGFVIALLARLGEQCLAYLCR